MKMKKLVVGYCTAAVMWVAMAVISDDNASATGLGAPIASAQQWLVLAEKDPMTDKLSCTAVLRGNTRVQLSSYILYVEVSGAPDAFQMRIDDNPPSGIQQMDDVDKRLSTISIQGDDFRMLAHATRLRLQVITYSDVFDLDLNIAGVSEALKILRSSRCA